MTGFRRQFWFSASFTILLQLGFGSAAAQPAFKDEIDGYVEKVRTEFEVPGIALAVVKDGTVVIAKGYGIRRIGEQARVDGKTLFAIASNTKAFTATALGILVEEGKLNWDAPVITYLPGFRLSNPYVTSELKVVDLLVHRSGLGLGAGDLLWCPPSTYTRGEIVRRLRDIPLATSFRSAYAYDNVLYLVAGELIEAVSGLSWEDFVSSMILRKIGMNESTVSESAAQEGSNAAAPHALLDGKLSIVKTHATDNVNPAGGINSCAEDMAKWLIVQLDSGRVADAPRLFSPETTVRLWGMVTPMPIGRTLPGLEKDRPNFSGYALGFVARDYKGEKMVMHTGGLSGFVSIVAMIPEEKLGVAVLTNQEAGEAYTAISRHVLDYYLGGEQTDWIGKLRALRARRDSIVASAEMREEMGRDPKALPSLPLDRYAGTYTDRWYGDVIIAWSDGKLSIRFSHSPELEGDLVHYQHDTFIAKWRDRELRADAFVTFALNPDGSIDEAKMKAVSPATDFSYDFQDLLLRPQR